MIGRIGPIRPIRPNYEPPESRDLHPRLRITDHRSPPSPSPTETDLARLETGGVRAGRRVEGHAHVRSDPLRARAMGTVVLLRLSRAACYDPVRFRRHSLRRRHLR